MAGDVKVAVAHGVHDAGGSQTTDYTVAGFGTVTACIVIMTFDLDDGTGVADESRLTIGFSDFTDNYAIYHQDEHASAKVDSDSGKTNTRCYRIISDVGTTHTGGTASAITDGVRLTNTAAGANEDPHTTVILLGGADLVVDIHSTGINSNEDGIASITTSGFTDGNDKLIFFIGCDVSGEDTISSGINNSFGVCHISGLGGGAEVITQRSLGWASDHNNAAGSPSAEITNDRCLNIIDEVGGEDWGLEVTALSAAGVITVTTRDTGAGSGMEVYSLSLDLDDRSAKVGSVDSPTTGSSWAPSVSLGFTPQYVGLGLTDLPTESDRSAGGTIDTSDQAGVHGISSVTGSGEETSHSWYNEDAAATTNTASLFRSRAIDLRDDVQITVLQDHSFSSFDSGGWTYTINSESEDVAKKWFYWAIETNAHVSETLAALSEGIMGIQNSFEGPFEI